MITKRRLTLALGALLALCHGSMSLAMEALRKAMQQQKKRKRQEASVTKEIDLIFRKIATFKQKAENVAMEDLSSLQNEFTDYQENIVRSEDYEKIISPNKTLDKKFNTAVNEVEDILYAKEQEKQLSAILKKIAEFKQKAKNVAMEDLSSLQTEFTQYSQKTIQSDIYSSFARDETLDEKIFNAFMEVQNILNAQEKEKKKKEEEKPIPIKEIRVAGDEIGELLRDIKDFRIEKKATFQQLMSNINDVQKVFTAIGEFELDESNDKKIKKLIRTINKKIMAHLRILLKSVQTRIQNAQSRDDVNDIADQGLDILKEVEPKFELGKKFNNLWKPRLIIMRDTERVRLSKLKGTGLDKQIQQVKDKIELTKKEIRKKQFTNRLNEVLKIKKGQKS